MGPIGKSVQQMFLGFSGLLTQSFLWFTYSTLKALSECGRSHYPVKSVLNSFSEFANRHLAWLMEQKL